MKPLSLLFTVFFPLLLSCNNNIANAVIKLPRNATIPAVVVFGDSVVDTGMNNYIITIAKCNFPPYGQDFLGGKPTGRFSNGKVPADFLAEELGIKSYLPPYLDPSLQDEDFLTGVNFASSAAGFDPLTSEISSVFSLTDQLEMFKEYIAKLKKIAGDERTSYIIRESLVAVVIGNNDFLINYFMTPLRSLQYDVPSYTDLLMSYFSTFLQDLYQLGARRIAVFGLPPLGCLPLERTLRGGLGRNCFEEYNENARFFNNRLSDEVASHKSQFPDATITFADIYPAFLDIIQTPQKYGFKIADRGCCGTGTIELAILCTFACSNVEDYVFWDGAHPTEKAYGIIVRRVLDEYINNFICGKSSC
ncbi:hypothetical protein ABFS82_03G072900 [Erythranthe guttata]